MRWGRQGDKLTKLQSRSSINTVLLSVDAAVALASTTAQWGDKRVFLLVLERLANECPASLVDWDTQVREGVRRVEHSDGWEWKLFTIARSFDLVLFLPFLYWRIAEMYSLVRVL